MDFARSLVASLLVLACTGAVARAELAGTGTAKGNRWDDIHSPHHRRDRKLESYLSNLSVPLSEAMGIGKYDPNHAPVRPWEDVVDESTSDRRDRDHRWVWQQSRSGYEDWRPESEVGEASRSKHDYASGYWIDLDQLHHHANSASGSIPEPRPGLLVVMGLLALLVRRLRRSSPARV